MPLTQGVKAVIEGSISYLFDLPSDASQFSQEVEKIKHAFAITSEEKEEGYEQLRTFIQFPEHFYKLEENNKQPVTQERIPMTVGEIQEYIFDYVTGLLEAAAKMAEVDWRSIDWNKESVLAELRHQPKFSKEFKSLHSPTVNHDPHPYEVDLNNPMCRAMVAPVEELDEEFLLSASLSHVDLHLTVSLPEEEEQSFTIKLCAFPANFFSGPRDDGNKFDEFILKVKKNIASVVALKKLSELIVEKLSLDVRAASPAAISLLSHPFYYSLVKKDRKVFDAFCGITKTQANNLMSPSIIRLIKEGKTDIPLAMDYSPHLIAVLSNRFYLEGVVAGRFIIEDFSENHADVDYLGDVTANQAKILNLPNITQLLAQGRLTLSEVKRISPDARDIFIDEFYFNLLLKNPQLFSSLRRLTREQTENLVRPVAKRLVQEDSSLLRSIKNASVYAMEILERNLLVRAFVKRGFIVSSQLDDVMTSEESVLLSEKDTENLTKIPESSLRDIAADFLYYSELGVLFDSDLSVLLEGVVDKEKEDIDALFKCLFFRNIQRRLTDFIDGRQIEIKKDKADNLKRIKKSCKKIEIDLSEVIEKELINRVNRYLKENDQEILDRFIELEQAGVSRTTLFGHNFGARLLAIFHKTSFDPSTASDNVETVEKDIQALSHNESIPLIDLHYAVVKVFLKGVRFYFLNSLDLNDPETPDLYFKLIAQVNYADWIERYSGGEPPTEASSCWKTALTNLGKLVHSEEKEPAAKVQKTPQEHKISYSPTLFARKAELGRLTDFIGTFSEMIKLGNR